MDKEIEEAKVVLFCILCCIVAVWAFGVIIIII